MGGELDSLGTINGRIADVVKSFKRERNWRAFLSVEVVSDNPGLVLDRKILSTI